jgi:serine/threonine-protein kinase
MQAGEIIGGKYELIRLLGQGGMGSVFEGRHIEIGRRVALKFLHAAFAQKEEMATRFLREAKAAAAIGSQHIVDITDVGRKDNGTPYLVMEYLEGKDLAVLIEQEGPMDQSRAAFLAVQICRGMAAAHERGIIHRDLTAKNVILTRREDGAEWIKILDFGIAKVLETSLKSTKNLTGAGMTLGTPHYMAPEQVWDASNVDHRVDIYSLGVILFELLTGGERPFTAETYPELILKVATMDPPSPRLFRPDLSEAFERIVIKAIAREADDRYDTMGALAADLVPFLVEGASPLGSSFYGLPQVTQDPVIRESRPSQVVPGPGERHSISPPARNGHLQNQSIPAASPSPPPLAFQPTPTPHSVGDPSHPGGPPSPIPLRLKKNQDSGEVLLLTRSKQSSGQPPARGTPQPRQQQAKRPSKPTSREGSRSPQPRRRSSSLRLSLVIGGIVLGAAITVVSMLFLLPESSHPIAAASSEPPREPAPAEGDAGPDALATDSAPEPDATANSAVVMDADEAETNEVGATDGGTDAETSPVVEAQDAETSERHASEGRDERSERRHDERRQREEEERQQEEEVQESADENLPDSLQSPSEAMENIRQHLRSNNAPVWACYERARGENPSLSGRVDVEVFLTSNGRVSSVRVIRSTLDDSTVEDCVSRAVRSLDFPNAASGNVIIINHTYNFYPR